MRNLMLALFAGGLVALSGQLYGQENERDPARAQQDATRDQASQSHEFCRASKLIGMTIRLETGSEDSVGQVEDVLFDKDSRMAHYLVVEYDTSILSAGKYMIVPWTSAEFMKATQETDAFVMLKLSQERIKQAPTITSDQFDKLGSNTAWMSQVNEFYRYELPQSHRVLKPDLNKPDVNTQPAPPLKRETDTNR